MAHTNTLNQRIIPITKGIIFGLVFSLSLMLGIETVHLNTHARLSAEVYTMEGLNHVPHDRLK